jgi:excisionase family DNA binding protein
MKGYLTTQEAADKLGVSVRRVVALINSGNLPSTRIGRSHVIKESDLKLVKERKPGRPPVAKK